MDASVQHPRSPWLLPTPPHAHRASLALGMHVQSTIRTCISRFTDHLTASPSTWTPLSAAHYADTSVQLSTTPVTAWLQADSTHMHASPIRAQRGAARARRPDGQGGHLTRTSQPRARSAGCRPSRRPATSSRRREEFKAARGHLARMRSSIS